MNIARACSGAVANRAGSKPEPSCAWKIAPVAAMPTEAPIMRDICRIPEATPAFCALTAFIAAVDIGDITRAIPVPISTKGTIRPL